MHSNNIAVVRGVVSSEPRQRELPSGSLVTNIEVTTDLDGERCSVPVVVHGRPVSVSMGDEVVVCGRVVRRFFRAAGSTASRTEVVADRLLPARQQRRVARLLAAVSATLSDDPAA